jgi:hypothetical protein
VILPMMSTTQAIQSQLRSKPHRGNQMIKYETGRWHNWLGGEIPFDLDTTDYYIATMDTSGEFYHQKYSSEPGGINVYHKFTSYGTWDPKERRHDVVVAFYVVSYGGYQGNDRG